jgi:hypothetical protein
MNMDPKLFKSVEECKADAHIELASETNEELQKIVTNRAYHYWFRAVAKEILTSRGEAA